MNKNEKGFSLIVVVIFMSIAALFVGYLMGSWLISFLVEDDSTEIAEEQKNTTNVNQQLASENSGQPKEVNNQENNLTAPDNGKEAAVSPTENTDNSSINTDNTNQKDQTKTETNNSSERGEIKGGFAVQIGAFSNYNNALTVKTKVEELGYELFITETTPHQVQVVGYSNRDQAEAALEELKSEGYNGFIVVRE
ncbi:MAG: SPOR domain-containing protein [Bacillota bacterium]